MTGLPLPDWESLTLAQQVAQMMVVRASGYLFDHQIQYPAWEPRADVLKRWLQLGVGGVILLGGSAAEVGLRSQQLQDWAIVPLLIAADIEEGVGQRFAGATWFPPPLALAAIARQNLAKAIDYAQQMGSTTAQEALAIGINWVLAPVVDVNNNSQNPVINVRAFGETTQTVRELSIAFLRGAQQHRVLTAAKHFPGHGDTAVDSHLALPVLPHSRARLTDIELPPFAGAIEAGVDAVMSAHLQIPALDNTDPATLSYAILTTLLRQQMGFEGLIVTDALVMGAIADRYGANEAPLLALEAGADILLMPLDPEGAIDTICRAVESGRIALARIQASIERIWRAKQKVCVLPLVGGAAHEWEKVSPLLDLGQLARSEAIETANQILQAAQIHSSGIKVSSSSHPLRNLILLDEALGCEFLGKQTPAIGLPQARGYSLQMADSYTAALLDGVAQSPVGHRASTLLQLFIRGNPFRGSAGLNQIAQNWVKFLLETGQLQALVIYGSPYVLEQFLPLPSEVPYVFTYGQMPAAQTIALSTLFDSLLS